MEDVDPSASQVRCPRHRHLPSRVRGRARSHPSVSSPWYTRSGTRARAWQQALVVNGLPAMCRTSEHGQLPLTTCWANSATVVAGPSSRSRHP